MAGDGKIELFKFIRKTYQDNGIDTSESNQGSGTNFNKWFAISGLGQLFITSAAYLLLAADSMIEYGRVFFTCATVLFYIILNLIFIWQMKNVLNYIGNCEQFIGTSK